MSDAAPTSVFGVSSVDLRAYDWQVRLAKHGCKRCSSFRGILAHGAEEWHAANDDLGRRVFSLLSVVASFHPNYDVKGNPYGSMWSGFDGKRALNAEDLSDADLTALSGIVEEIEDPEFRARVADILWVTKKDFKVARIAISAFLESAQRLKTDDRWPPYTERLERAARIGAIRGFEKEHRVVVAAIEAAISEFELNAKAGLLCHRLMSILFAQGEGECTRYVEIAERLATDFAKVGNWHFSEAYWLLAEQWHRRANNDTDAHRCRLAAAECNVSRGESGLLTQGAMYAAHWVGRGLEALRQGKASPERITEVYRRFLELEKLGLTEMKQIEVDIDKIPGFRENEKCSQEWAAAYVRGHDVQKALELFANITQPTNLADLKEQLAKSSELAVFSKIWGTSMLDHTEKVSDTLPPTGFGNANEEAEALRKQLCQEACTTNWPMRVFWKIEPARIAMRDEHAMRYHEIRFLVSNNPFIPQGHEGIYLLGLHAGFLGDWLTAMHLLIPQVEASIRYVLQQHGVITSTLNADGTQEERDINQLLWLQETERIFGEDILFDLRGILIERFGHNIRNEVAHGLLPEGGFYQPVSVYLWWLILHLCWKGFRIAQRSAFNSAQELTSPGREKQQ